jgi:ornithine cyclodeaminase/alanine dehydrogenase-like protein (mu-crystallin family)
VKILALDADDVAAACPMKRCIEEMSRSFALQAKGRIQSPLRTRVAAPAGDVLVMSSLVRRSRFEGSVKVVGIFPRNKGNRPSISATVVLVDGESGEAKALLEGARLTAIRTGAVSGLSCRYLAREDSKTLGVVGAGGQAFQQVNGVVSELRGVSKVKVFSRHLAKSKAVAKACARAFKVDARAEDSVGACVKGSDVLVTATTSRTPVIDGREVEEGTHVIAIGSYRPDARELDSLLVAGSSVFVDSRDAALEEAGDLLIPMAEGLVTKASVRAELSELVTGSKKGRVLSSEVTIFKSVGLAFEDNAAGWLAYRGALRAKLGKWVEL